jgi:hypothetical protein
MFSEPWGNTANDGHALTPVSAKGEYGRITIVHLDHRAGSFKPHLARLVLEGLAGIPSHFAEVASWCSYLQLGKLVDNMESRGPEI